MITSATLSARQAAQNLCAHLITKGYAIEALHRYEYPDGRLTHHVVRMVHAAANKEIRPMTLVNGTYKLCLPEPGHGRPLYNLVRLTNALPSEIIVVVEGEKCVDCLTAIDVLATTSSGGASVVQGSDWSALTGRKVIIWPDNDRPGADYAKAVQERIKDVASSVSVIDVSRLHLPAKGDAVDWVQAHPEAAPHDVYNLPQVWVDLVVPYEKGDLVLRRSGLYCDLGDQQRFVCSPLHIRAKSRDAKSHAWGRYATWEDDDEKKHSMIIPMDILQGDGTELRRQLARGGLRIGAGRAISDLLVTYIQNAPASNRVRCVSQTGWNEDAFVTRGSTFGRTSEEVVLQTDETLAATAASRGTADSWRTSIGEPSRGNPSLIFGISAALAAPLMQLAAVESGLFHIFGNSTSGKTTALRVVASVYGPPTALRTWHSTLNGMESIAALHNDQPLLLDEISQVREDQLGNIAYLLSNSLGKQRADKGGLARAQAAWRILVLSSGEETLGSILARNRQQAKAGQELRFIDIAADAGRGMGIFAALHGRADARALADEMRAATTKHYGAVGDAWLKDVVAKQSELRRGLPSMIDAFVAKHAPPDRVHAQAARVCRRFALIAAAGELATRDGLTGWAANEAMDAAAYHFNAWVEGFGGVRNREEQHILTRVREFFERNSTSRFQNLDADRFEKIHNQAGYVDSDGEKRTFYVLPSAFATEIASAGNRNMVIDVLTRRGWLLPDKRGSSQKPRLRGVGTPRVYVFTDKMFEADIE